MKTRSAWERFPLYLMLAMGLVIAVNARFVWSAIATFPGATTNDDFDTSNAYDRVLAHVAAQRALGWTVSAETDAGVAAATLSTEATGAALSGCTVTAAAVRPLGTQAVIGLAFRETSSGRYVATAKLPLPGQWDLQFQIHRGLHEMRVTRRVVVR